MMKIGNIELNEKNMNVVHGKVIKIKYFDNEIDKVEKISMDGSVGLRAAKDISLKAGETALIPLGVDITIPKGYEAILLPCFDTFEKYAIFPIIFSKTNNNFYDIQNGQWFFSAFALKDTTIFKNDKICDLRINGVRPPIKFVEIED